MTVAELILELQKMPQDFDVFVFGEETTDVKIVSDYPLGDNANPKCEYADVVWIE